jgi:hypothetical protein
MRSLIQHVPTGIILDLSERGLGHPDGREILKRHYRQSEQAHPEFDKGNPAFICLRHHEGTNPGLYLKLIKGHWWAVHYERDSACHSIQVAEPMSDEHRRQVDYWVRAAQDAGWHAETERTLVTGARPDALIHGDVDTGIEVQRYAMTASAAVRRSSRIRRSNVLDVWFTSRIPAPEWTYRVPTVSEAGLPWDVVPPRGSAVAVGLRAIMPMRCSVENFRRCPETGGRRCGKRHPMERPWRGLTVDDVAAKAPGGQIVPMLFRRNSRSHDVFLVSPASLALYEEMTGRIAALTLGPVTEMVPPTLPAGEVECRNDQPERPAKACYRCYEKPVGPGGILCTVCKLDIEAGYPCAP